MSEFVLKRGDTLPVMHNVPIDPAGDDYLPASGDVGLLKVYLPTGLFQRTTETVIGASFDYAWQEDDWNYLSPGIHRMELEVTLAAGGVLTFPNRRYDKLIVDDDLDGAAAAPLQLDGAMLLEAGVSAKVSALTAGAPAMMTDRIHVSRGALDRYLTVADLVGGGLADRFPGVEYVFYGAAKDGKAAPTGPEIVISAADFRNSFSVPVTIIAAVPGRVIVPVRWHMRKEAGSAGFVAGSNTGVRLHLTNVSGVPMSAARTMAQLRFDQATEEAQFYMERATTGDAVFGSLNAKIHVGLTTQNTPLVLCGLTANITSDGSPVYVSILAELWPVSVS